MTITLLAVSLNDSPLTQPITACFDARGGTIGRADHNTMALPDPERHISRLQAEVTTSGAGFLIKNVGAANPITIAGRQLLAGESSPLCHHDEVRIGGYLLRVIDDIGADPNSPGLLSGRARVPDSVADPLMPPVQLEGPEAAKQVQRPTGQPLPLSGRDLAVGFAGVDSVGPLSSDNPFAELLGSDRSEPRRTAHGGRRMTGAASNPFADLAPPSGLPSESPALPATDTPARSAVLPDDFDPFAAAPKPQQAALPPSKSDPFADLLSASESQSIDSMFGLHPSSGSDDALARFSDDRKPGLASGEGGALAADPLELLGIQGAAPRAEPPPFSNHTPDLRASFMPPKWVSPVPTVEPAPGGGGAPTSPAAIPSDVTWLHPRPGGAPVSSPNAGAVPRASAFASEPRPVTPAVDVLLAPSTSTSASSIEAGARTALPASEEALWQAFCEGAGVTMTLPRGLDATTMRSLGQLIHAAVAGTLQLIAVRASTKQELRADVTMIQSRANNPLKFSPDVQTGLEQLLNPPMRGFLAGPEAMTDAMNDLVGHSIGTMAGMRAALDGVMARFAPTELETKLTGAALLDSLLPMSRKARLWDLYLKHFDTIREEAQDDFHTLFGKAFLAAYGQQIDRLKASRSSK